MKEYSAVLNADMGESFGRYKLGNDEELMKYVTSANLACGFHAGDPTVMRATVRLAKKYDVAVGAHPGFQDLRGFGRRTISITPEELVDDLLYQLGALGAFLKAEGMKMWHLSPHGWLDPLVSYEEKYADAFMKIIQEYDSELIRFCKCEGKFDVADFVLDFNKDNGYTDFLKTNCHLMPVLLCF